jgi:hypothetical protein
MARRLARMPCISKTEPICGSPGINQPESRLPDALSNVTVSPCRSGGGGPITARAGAHARLPARCIAPNASAGTPKRNMLTQRDGFRMLLPSLGYEDLRCDPSECAFSHRVHAFFKDLLFCIRIALDVPYHSFVRRPVPVRVRAPSRPVRPWTSARARISLPRVRQTR